MRLLLTYLLLVFTLSVSAQKIRFTDSTNTWITYWDMPDCGYRAIYYYDGGTVYNGFHYRNLFRVSSNIWSADLCTITMVQSLYIREDTIANRVFCINLGTGDTIERVLYDYNLNMGDSIHYGDGSSWVGATDSVTEYDSTIINGSIHKVLALASGRHSVDRQYTVVEGVGCLSGPYYPTFGNCFEFDERVVCFSNKGTYPDFNTLKHICHGLTDTFKNAWSCSKLSVDNTVTKKQLQVYPNPVNETLNVSMVGYSDFPMTLLVSDLLGHTVLLSSIENNDKAAVSTADLPQGTYILNIGNGLYSERKVITVVH